MFARTSPHGPFDNFNLLEHDGPVVIILATDPRFAGSNPAGVDGFFSEHKNSEYDFFGREVKPWVLCHRFTALKRTSS